MSEPLIVYNSGRGFTSEFKNIVRSLFANGVSPVEIINECREQFPELRTFTLRHVKEICMRRAERREARIQPISLTGPEWSMPEGAVHWKMREDQRG